MNQFTPWSRGDAAAFIAVPGVHADKYSRGVLGVITGSAQYPGAAVLGVEAALRTGVGMVRYLGPARARELVLQRRPEAVTVEGRVQAWLIGSGMDHAVRDETGLQKALESGVPLVLDGGALDLVHSASGPVVITPHYGELARVLSVAVSDIADAPGAWCARAAGELGATVVLKGHTTYVAGPSRYLSVQAAPSWLATAGAGDALAGILGALVATHSVQPDLPALAATAALIHGLAAERASGGGPLTILDLCGQIPAIVAELISPR